MFNKKVKFFKEKLKRIEKSIWDLEFKLTESRKVREGIRLDRDRIVETQGLMNTKLEDKTLTEEARTKLEQDLTKAKDTQTRFERQMQMLDNELNGKIATETEDGIQGVNYQIESLVSLREMTKNYIKKL